MGEYEPGAGQSGEDGGEAGVASGDTEDGEDVSDIQGELETMRKKLRARELTCAMRLLASVDFVLESQSACGARTSAWHGETARLRGLEY